MEAIITDDMITVDPILKYFIWPDMPGLPDPVDRPSPRGNGYAMWFGLLAIDIAYHVPRSPERTVALRKLLESKDAAVRAMLP